jgi:hypothetical protein
MEEFMGQPESNKIIKISDLSNHSIDSLVEAYKNGWTLEGITKIVSENIQDKKTKSLTPTCNVTSKTVGQVVTLTATPKGGTAPYSVEFVKNGTIEIQTFTNVSEGQTLTSKYTLVSSDVGSVLFSAAVSDSCPSGSKEVSENCTITVNSPSPGPGPGPSPTCNSPIANLILT